MFIYNLLIDLKNSKAKEDEVMDMRYNNILSLFIYLYIFLLPILPSKFNFKGVPLNGDIILLITILIYLLGIIIIKNNRKKFITKIRSFFTNGLNISIVLLTIVMFLSTVYAVDKSTALKESLRFSTYIILYFIIYAEIDSREKINKALGSYIFSCIIISLVSIFDYFKGIGAPQPSSYGIKIRVESLLENSNNLGAFFVIAIFPCIMLLIYEKDRKKKIFYLISSLLFLFNIVTSFSRNAWLGFAIGCLLIIVMYEFRFFIPVAILGGASLFIPQIFNRIKEFGDLSQNLSRIKLWETAFYMIKDHPILGVGIGNFASLYDEYIKKYRDLRYCGYKVFHPHNIFLKIQSELGIIGTIVFTIMIIFIIVKLRQLINREESNFYKLFYKGFFVSFIAFMGMNLIDNFFSAPKVIAYIWILLALSQSIVCRRNINRSIY